MEVKIKLPRAIWPRAKSAKLARVTLKPHAHDDVIEDLVADRELALADLFKPGPLIEGDGAMVLVISAEQHPCRANLARMFQRISHQLAACAGAVIL